MFFFKFGCNDTKKLRYMQEIYSFYLVFLRTFVGKAIWAYDNS